MSGDEIREERIGETVRGLGEVYMQAREHILGVAEYRDARAGGGDIGVDAERDGRGQSEGLVNDLVLMQRVINRAAAHPDVVAKLPASALEEAGATVRRSLDIAKIVHGVTVPSYEELQVAATEEPLLWADQYERLSTFYDRAQDMLDKVDAASESADERGMLLSIADMDDFIEDLDRENDILGQPQTVELRRMIAIVRDKRRR
ncbi:MAG: hypothetical protein ACRDS9_13405 [Pseudonocardiaceae bacterium]